RADVAVACLELVRLAYRRTDNAQRLDEVHRRLVAGLEVVFLRINLNRQCCRLCSARNVRPRDDDAVAPAIRTGQCRIAFSVCDTVDAVLCLLCEGRSISSSQPYQQS